MPAAARSARSGGRKLLGSRFVDGLAADRRGVRVGRCRDDRSNAVSPASPPQSMTRSESAELARIVSSPASGEVGVGAEPAEQLVVAASRRRRSRLSSFPRGPRSLAGGRVRRRRAARAVRLPDRRPGRHPSRAATGSSSSSRRRCRGSPSPPSSDVAVADRVGEEEVAAGAAVEAVGAVVVEQGVVVAPGVEDVVARAVDEHVFAFVAAGQGVVRRRRRARPRRSCRGKPEVRRACRCRPCRRGGSSRVLRRARRRLAVVRRCSRHRRRPARVEAAAREREGDRVAPARRSRVTESLSGRRCRSGRGAGSALAGSHQPDARPWLGSRGRHRPPRGSCCHRRSPSVDVLAVDRRRRRRESCRRLLRRGSRRRRRRRRSSPRSPVPTMKSENGVPMIVSKARSLRRRLSSTPPPSGATPLSADAAVRLRGRCRRRVRRRGSGSSS